MENNTLTPDKQEAIEAFEKKQKRMFQVGRGTVWAIIGWDIYAVLGMFLIAFFLVPGLDWLETDDVANLLNSAVGVDTILVRGSTWVSLVSGFFDVTGISELLSDWLWSLPDGVRQSARDVVNYFLPGLLCCLTGGLVFWLDIAIFRGASWARIVRAFFAAACVIGAVGRLLLFPGDLLVSIIFLALEFAVCYMLFFSKSVKEYTYAVNRQF